MNDQSFGSTMLVSRETRPSDNPSMTRTSVPMKNNALYEIHDTSTPQKYGLLHRAVYLETMV